MTTLEIYTAALLMGSIVLVFFIFLTTDLTDERQIYLFMGTIVPVPTLCVLGFPYFSFTTFALPKR